MHGYFCVETIASYIREWLWQQWSKFRLCITQPIEKCHVEKIGHENWMTTQTKTIDSQSSWKNTQID